MKKKCSPFFVRFITLIIFFVTVISNTTAQSWTSVDGGGLSTSTINSSFVSSAVYNNELYAIWEENGKIHIKKYNGTTWASCGNASGQSQLNESAFSASNPKLITYNGFLYAAWNECDISGDPNIPGIHVKRYNGTSWSFVQDYTTGENRKDINKELTCNATNVDLAVYNGELYAAWLEYANATSIYQLRVSKFNGSLWTPVDGNGIYGLNYNTSNNLSAVPPSLCVYNNQLYVVWNEIISTKSQLRIRRYDSGSVWTFIDGGGDNGLNYNSTISAYTPNLTSDNNNLYLFWRESNKVRIKQYNGSGWSTESDGGSGWSHNGTTTTYNPFGIKFGNLNYIAWEENVSAIRQIRMVSFDGATKTYIDGDGLNGINQSTSYSANDPSLTVYNGDLYAFWTEDKDGTEAIFQIRAKKYPLPPFVQSVSVPANATYIAGQTLTFTVNFSKDVVISSGSPYLLITLNTGGTVNATYTGGSGTSALTFSYTVASGNADNDGVSVGTTIAGATLQSEDASPITANLTLNNVGSTASVKVDAVAPTITAATLAANNTYIDITFSEGIYGASNGITPLSASKFALTFTKNSGNATNAVVSSVKKNDNTVEASASALSGGETSVRVFLIITGTPSGLETIEIKPANGTSVYDQAGNAALNAQTTGVKTLNDLTPPTMVSAVRTDDTHLTLTLSKNCVNIVKANEGGFSVCETGQPTITYTVSSIAQGTDASRVVLTLANMSISGKEGVTIKYTTGGNGTVQDVLGNAMATNSTGVNVTGWDITSPNINSGTLSSENNYMDIVFNEGVYGSSNGITPLNPSSFAATFTKNGATTDAAISSVKNNNSTVEATASALTGGETTVRVFLSVTGTPQGIETIEIKPYNGTAIYDKAGNASSALQTSGIKTLNDKLAPSVSTVNVPLNGFYTGGQNLDFTVNFSEAVTVNTTGGIPYISITLETGGTVNAFYQSGSGTSALVFRYTVAAGNYDSDGVTAGTAITLNSGTIKDAAGNNATLTLNGVATTSGVLVDAIIPSVFNVTSATANGTYKIGDVITVTVVFTEAVYVTESPTIALNSGGTSYYVSGNGSSVLTFNYTVSSGHNSSDLDYSSTNALNLAGGSIKDVAGNSIILTLPAVGGSNSLGGQKNIVVDGISPSVSSVSSTTANGTYKTGDVIAVTITFSEAATVTGTPTLSLNSGGTASYASGSGSTVLTFNYTVTSGNSSTDLDYSSTAALSLSAGTIKDAAGNSAALTLPTVGGASSIGGQKNIMIDGIAPSINITSTTSSFTNVSPIPVTITFSESVTGFVVGDISVTNGSLSNFSGSGTTYTADITPASQGLITMNVAGGVAQDIAGNNNTAATQFSRTFDNVVPSVTITSTAPNPTKTSPIPVTITFSESVTGFNDEDIAVTNGIKGVLNGSGATYTMDITPSGQGTVTVDIAASAAQDAAGYNNTAATQFSRVYDNQAPSVSVSSIIGDPTNLSTIPLDIVFSEAVTGFTLSDIVVSTGTASNLQTTDNIHWTATITFIGMGGKSVTIADGIAQDLAGNGNTASPYFQRTYDPNAPTVTLSSTSPNPTKDKPMVVNITFNETVVDFYLSNIQVTNGTASNLQTDYYQENWTVDIYPAADGEVTVDIPAGAAKDQAGNNNTAAVQFSRTCDITSPTVVISSTSTSSTNSNPIPVNIVFNETVTGFDASDITVVNGTKGALSGSGSTYAIDITPSAQGVVTINIGANAAQDAVGNASIAATQFSRTYDVTAPLVSSIERQTPVFSNTNASSVVYRITFNESVKGLDIGDFTLTLTGTVTGIVASASSASGTTIDVTVNSITGNGSLRLDLKNTGTGITDDAGNAITGGYTSGQTYFIDKIAPTTLSINRKTPSSGLTNATSVIYSASFSENVTGFDVGDFLLTSTGTASGTIASISIGTTVDVTVNSISGDGTLRLDLKNSGTGITDVAGNEISGGFTGGESYTIDQTSPTITITSTTGSSTNVSPIPVTFTFSEPVTGFDAGDITVTNGTASGFSGSGAAYTINVTPLAQGNVTVAVAAGVASDAVGNSSIAAVTLTRTFDNVSPSVSITSTANNPTGSSIIPVTITFSEPVTGFVAGDVAATNGTISNFAGNGSVYSLDVTASAPGAVSINVVLGVAEDAAGNTNTSAAFNITYVVPPTITGTTPGSNCGAGSVVLSATASSGTINWYSSATGGTSLGTGTSFTTPVINATTTYYVDASANGVTTLTRTAVVATIKTIPSITGSTPASRCGTGTVTLGATISAGTADWYNAATGGSSIGSGLSFVTPSITATTTYYVAVTDNGCTSVSRTAVVATVNNVPDQPSVITGNSTSINGTKEIYSVTNISGVTYQWVATNGTVSRTGNSVEITWNAAGAQTVTVTPSNSCGAGTSRTLNVTVNPSTVGIGEVSGTQAYKIFPNPAEDFIIIENASEMEANVKIYSFGNSLVLEKTIRAKAERIDIGSLSTGVYSIIITNKNGKQVQKLIRK